MACCVLSPKLLFWRSKSPLLVTIMVSWSLSSSTELILIGGARGVSPFAFGEGKVYFFFSSTYTGSSGTTSYNELSIVFFDTFLLFDFLFPFCFSRSSSELGSVWSGFFYSLRLVSSIDFLDSMACLTFSTLARLSPANFESLRVFLTRLAH